MGRYIQRRLLISIPILLMVTVLIFGLLQLTPGDPLAAFLPPDSVLPDAQKEALRQQLGLDKPAPVRYLYWLRETAQGNFGYRLKTFEPITEAISGRIGATLLLMGTAMTIGILLGVTLGVIAAVKQYSFLDNVLTIFAFLGVSFPVYLAGLLALYLFSLRFRIFPAGGLATPGEPFSFTDRLEHLILPAAIISINYVASTMRYTRSAMLEVMTADYVRTARAKGLREKAVILRHGLRNALLPVVTIIGAYIPNLLGGAVFIESIFSWPGLGRLYLEGIEGRDYNLIMAMTLILAVVIMIANLLTDIVYGLIDPRIRYE
ncbi:MAG: ABC transporter permease [Thermomicrobiales bacterium]